MSSLKELDFIKNEFNKNINSIDDNNFKHTKGLLTNFGDYIEENKTFLYGLAGITLFGAVNKSAVEVFNYLKEDSSYTQQIEQINNNGIDIYNKIKEFNKASNYNHSTINVNYKKDLQEINFNEIEKLYETTDKVVEYKNPFWKNNTFKLVIDNESFPHFLGEIKPNERIDRVDNESMLLMDRGENTITLDIKDIEYMAKEGGVSNLPLFKKFVLYHEAAHGSKDQLYHNGKTMDLIDREINSDLSALMMIGVETKDLQVFNEATQDLINFRSGAVKHSDYTHNTVYSIMELKNAINNNPNLLNLKKDDIVEFSNQFQDQIKQHDFSNKIKNTLDSSGIDYTKEGILKNIKEGNNISVLDVVAKEFLWNNKRIADVKDEFSEERLDRLARRLENDMFRNPNQAKLSEMVYYSKGMDKNEMIKNLELAIKEDSAINPEFIKMIDSKIKIDELDMDFKSLQQVRLQIIAENAQAHMVRNNSFKYN